MKMKARQVVGFCSLLINLLPLFIYPMLVFQKNGDFTNFIPYAVYYAFRHSSLILFRDWENNYPILGKIGLISGLVGSILGLFGGLDSIFWQLSAVGLGIGSALFPTAVNQNKRSAQTDTKVQPSSSKKKSLGKQLSQLVVVIVFLVLAVMLRSPFMSFAIMTVTNGIAFYCYQYRTQKITRPATIHWYNYALAFLLFAAMFLIGVSRKTGNSEPISWGIMLLSAFLVLMTILLAINWRQKSKAKIPLYTRMALFYGVCGQYWSMYSTIFVGAQYGVQLYAWVIVAYVLAVIFGKTFAGLVISYSKVDPLTISLLLTIFGIGLTFWLPTYFIGIFLIRAFSKKVNDMALTEYEQQTKNYQISYISNYYYSVAGGMVSQLVMWASLFIFLKSAGIRDILTAYIDHKPSLYEFSSINGAHMVLAVYMILFSIFVLCGKLRLAK